MKLRLKLFCITTVAIFSTKCSSEYEKLSDNQNSEIREKPLELEQNTSRFYTKPKASVLANEKNLVTDFGVNNRDSNDDSDKLNEAIMSLSNSDGGKLFIPKGKYYLNNIKMLSNVHIEIEKDTEIYPTIGLASNKNHRIFDFASMTSEKIENASIVGKGGRFIVDLKNNSSQNLIVVDLGNVNNFELADFTIKDKKTIFASILVSFTNKSGDAWPHNGIIQNINQIDSHTGYGLIQAYAADNILFNNLKCTGGVTLRLETDNLAMKAANKGGVRDIYATKITNINGLTPVMFSPHFMENGKVTINDVTAIGCAYAVRVEHGFIEIFDKDNRANGQEFKDYIEGILGNGSVSELYKRNNGRTWAVRIDNDYSQIAYNSPNPAVNGIKPGKFENSTVTDVKVIYKNTGAKLKHLFLPYLPCSEQTKVCKPGASGFEYNGPSLGVSIDNTKRDNSLGNYNVNVTTSLVQGFPSNYILNVKYNTPKLCNPNLSSIPACD